jgi:hypothetical protein
MEQSGLRKEKSIQMSINESGKSFSKKIPNLSRHWKESHYKRVKVSGMDHRPLERCWYLLPKIFLWISMVSNMKYLAINV